VFRSTHRSHFKHVEYAVCTYTVDITQLSLHPVATFNTTACSRYWIFIVFKATFLLFPVIAVYYTIRPTAACQTAFIKLRINVGTGDQ
jgi:hypothetical protein